MSVLRHIVLDTETTGLDPSQGDRLIEIGCVELINYLPTGKIYHTYINPQREVSEKAYEVHGRNLEFLKDYPLFSDVHQDFLDFISDSHLVIHNAPFDMKFLNAELKVLGAPSLSYDRVIDTLALARKKYPGSPASLDALCRRFEIDNSNRDLHGALVDSYLLAQVYLELIGGRQPGFNLTARTNASSLQNPTLSTRTKKERPPRSIVTLTPQEIKAHHEFMQEIIKS